MSSRRRMLCDAVEHLASEPSAQQAYLASIGDPEVVDELALEFDDVAAASDDMLAVGELTPQEHREIGSINDLLIRISGKADAHLWAPAALATSAGWAAIRQQAQKCLRIVGKRNQIDYANFIREPARPHPPPSTDLARTDQAR